MDPAELRNRLTAITAQAHRLAEAEYARDQAASASCDHCYQKLHREALALRGDLQARIGALPRPARITIRAALAVGFAVARCRGLKKAQNEHVANGGTALGGAL